jgi:hypothetical protein
MIAAVGLSLRPSAERPSAGALRAVAKRSGLRSGAERLNAGRQSLKEEEEWGERMSIIGAVAHHPTGP